MPTNKQRINFTPESQEKKMLEELASIEGRSLSRMMGLLIRRAYKELTGMDEPIGYLGHGENKPEK